MAKLLSSYALLAFVFCFLLLSSNAEAQTEVKISGFSNFSFGTWSSGSVSSSDGLCVYKSDGDTSYVITASGAAGSFSVTSGSNYLSFSVDFKQSGGSYVSLTHGIGQSFSGANQSAGDCGGSTNATLSCSFSSTDLEAASPGSYSGTLYVMVEPS